ncbi:MAG: hypothetical protein KGI50_03765 [Patescibacteria group bacterium]|nr:hypothetical protein [Patescibacteria group bacterium]MDE2438406.1 hypothetical protein [Patescibacteria group bacterium]
MDVKDLPLSTRKRLFALIVGVAGFFALLLWFVMFESHIHALTKANIIDEVLSKQENTTTTSSDTPTPPPSLGSVISSLGANIWDITISIPQLFHAHEIDVNNTLH